MFIDLNFKNTYDIDKIVTIPKEYYKDSEIIDLKDIKVVGRLYYDEDDKLYITLKAEGIMIIQDSISLKEVSYPYLVEYDDVIPENLKKDKEKLDLFEFLWENIVLEVPLRFTEVDDYSEYSGNGWKLINEGEKVNNNPFSDLLKNFDKKE